MSYWKDCLFCVAVDLTCKGTRSISPLDNGVGTVVAWWFLHLQSLEQDHACFSGLSGVARDKGPLREAAFAVVLGPPPQ